MNRRMILVLASVVLSACAAESRVDAPSNSPQEMPVPEDRYAKVGDLSLHYLDWSGEGDLMVLVPGLWHTAHTYDAIAPSFTDQYHVVALTRREHGASQKGTGPISLDGLVEDLSNFIRLFTEDPVILVGQSFAGIEIARLAARHPERVKAIVLLDAVYDWAAILSPNQPPYPTGYQFQHEYRSFDALAEWFEATYPEIWSPAMKAHLLSQTVLTTGGRVAWQFPWDSPLGGEFFGLFAAWTPQEYQGIQVPVLSIQSDFGGFFEANLERRGASAAERDAAREWAAFDASLKRRGTAMLLNAVPDAVIAQMDSTHHWLHLQRPEPVARAMREFLRAAGIR